MKKKRVEKAIRPFAGVRIRYDAGKQPDDTPVEVTIWGTVQSTLEVTLGDLRRLWELHDAAFVERIIVLEPDEIRRGVTNEELMSLGYCYCQPDSITTAKQHGTEFLNEIREIIADVGQHSNTPEQAARVTAFAILVMLDGSGEHIGKQYRVTTLKGKEVTFFHHDL